MSGFYLTEPRLILIGKLLRLGNYHVSFEFHQPTPEGGRYLHFNRCVVFLSLLPYLCFLSELVIDCPMIFLSNCSVTFSVLPPYILNTCSVYFETVRILAYAVRQYLYRIHAVNTVIAHIAVS